ncbi:conserved hypothetical protein [Histoplasma capsulatum H143]|uniref:Uncharacterized protein n=1 Tax=Ajellomyces capsulatus (strain H143) TaxID=544712 RepID=C6H927_AJECH|nr:conserved hypothetical protein [Histoplasma capsulatum H143]
MSAASPLFAIRPVRSKEDLKTSKLKWPQEKESSQTPNDTPQTLGCIALRELHLHGHGDIHGRVPLQPSVQEGKAARVTSQLHAGPVGEADDGKAPGPTTRKPDTKYCELKRLYVTPAARGLGAEVRLDALSEMREAIAQYKILGFGAVEKYYERAIEGTVFLGLKLLQ